MVFGASVVIPTHQHPSRSWNRCNACKELADDGRAAPALVHALQWAWLAWGSATRRFHKQGFPGESPKNGGFSLESEGKVEWELLDRGELHLIRPDPSPQRACLRPSKN